MSTLLESLFYHVTLPPRLPGKQDHNTEKIEHALASRLLDATRALRDLVDEQSRDQWDCVRRALQSCRIINAGGRICRNSLLNELRSVECKDLLLLHIAEQNAGLLIRRHHE